MATPQPPANDPPPAQKGSNYASYQTSIYAAGLQQNHLPRVTTDPNKLEAQAKSRLSARSYGYVAGGAGEGATMDANRLAFRQWKIIPRMLRPTPHRDLRVSLFGKTYDTPLIIAPIGVQSIFHEDKETGVAEVAAELGIPYCLSTAASSNIEEVAEASEKGREDAPRWFQLYWPTDDEVTISLLNRAKKNNYTVLVVTLDTFSLSWRPHDLDNAYVPFIAGIGNAIGFSDPVFRSKLAAKHSIAPEDDVLVASREWTPTAFPGVSHSWEDLAFLKQHWDGPIVLKGIQHPADAALAAHAGVHGVVVSNHGGRQVDGAIGSLEMLPEIVDALRGTGVEVLFDSGVRTGADVVKAISLGAKGVLLGRPWCYGLAVAGKQGASDVMKGILADIEQTLGLAGIGSISDCSASLLRRTSYGGDLASSK
ncbi:MAG: hypothetical protein M1819_004134 [Sarea resinae]|nr:MAG: hypothetical protein M1819_004134 [Sarea resinae]